MRSFDLEKIQNTIINVAYAQELQDLYENTGCEVVARQKLIPTIPDDMILLFNEEQFDAKLKPFYGVLDRLDINQLDSFDYLKNAYMSRIHWFNKGSTSSNMRVFVIREFKLLAKCLDQALHNAKADSLATQLLPELIVTLSKSPLAMLAVIKHTNWMLLEYKEFAIFTNDTWLTCNEADATEQMLKTRNQLIKVIIYLQIAEITEPLELLPIPISMIIGKKNQNPWYKDIPDWAQLMVTIHGEDKKRQQLRINTAKQISSIIAIKNKADNTNFETQFHTRLFDEQNSSWAPWVLYMALPDTTIHLSRYLCMDINQLSDAWVAIQKSSQDFTQEIQKTLDHVKQFYAPIPVVNTKPPVPSFSAMLSNFQGRIFAPAPPASPDIQPISDQELIRSMRDICEGLKQYRQYKKELHQLDKGYDRAGALLKTLEGSEELSFKCAVLDAFFCKETDGFFLNKGSMMGFILRRVTESIIAGIAAKTHQDAMVLGINLLEMKLHIVNKFDTDKDLKVLKNQGMQASECAWGKNDVSSIVENRLIQ